MGLFDKLSSPIFLKEDSDVAEFLKQLAVLKEKMNESQQLKIDKEMKLASIGEAGEQNIAFELKHSGMPMYILHDIHLQIDGISAQIDYIVVTRKIIFIIECKNLIGDIEIDEYGNFIRSYNWNGKVIREGIYSPITQNERHLEVIKQLGKQSKSNIIIKALFEKYFNENYQSIVVLANPKTLLNAKHAKEDIKRKVIRADQLINYMKEACKNSRSAQLNDKDMKALAEKILSWHQPKTSDYVKKYKEIEQAFRMPDLKEGLGKTTKLEGLSEKTKVKKEIIQEQAKKGQSSETKLVELLKAYRLETSRKEKIKPYFIFNDQQMMNLISSKPNTEEELLSISGFGPVKVQKYGQAILHILNE